MSQARCPHAGPATRTTRSTSRWRSAWLGVSRAPSPRAGLACMTICTECFCVHPSRALGPRAGLVTRALADRSAGRRAVAGTMPPRWLFETPSRPSGRRHQAPAQASQQLHANRAPSHMRREHKPSRWLSRGTACRGHQSLRAGSIVVARLEREPGLLAHFASTKPPRWLRDYVDAAASPWSSARCRHEAPAQASRRPRHEHQSRGHAVAGTRPPRWPRDAYDRRWYACGDLQSQALGPRAGLATLRRAA